MQREQHTDAASSQTNTEALSGQANMKTPSGQASMTTPSSLVSNDTSETLLTMAQMARRLNVKVKSIYNWRAEGYFIPGEVRVGPHTIRFRPRDVEAWIAAGGLKREEG